MFRAIQLTMFTAPHPLIVPRTVQRQRVLPRKLTLLSLPNDTFVDLIFIQLCVRDILRLRSVCIRHLYYMLHPNNIIDFVGMQTILRTNTPTNGLEAHLAHLSPSTAASPSYHPLFLPISQRS